MNTAETASVPASPQALLFIAARHLLAQGYVRGKALNRAALEVTGISSNGEAVVCEMGENEHGHKVRIREGRGEVRTADLEIEDDGGPMHWLSVSFPEVASYFVQDPQNPQGEYTAYPLEPFGPGAKYRMVGRDGEEGSGSVAAECLQTMDSWDDYFLGVED